MADSLRLKGTKHVINQTGDEFKLRRPKRGGDVHMVPRWWAMKKTVNYLNAAIFDVQTSGGPLAMVIPADAEATDISIIADGDGNFIFPIHRCVDRVAIMAPDLSVFYEEYQFAKISGGPVLRRTVNPLPQGVAFTGNCTVTGTAQEGEVLTATPAPFTGGIGSPTVSIRWQSRADGGGQWNNIQTQNSGPFTYTVQGSNVGSQLRAQTRVTDTPGTVVKNSTPTASVIAAAVVFSDLEAAAAQTLTVTVDSGKFVIDGVSQAPVSANAGDIIIFDLTDASNSSHPLRIYTDSNKTTEVTVGITIEGDKVAFQPPIAGTFSYQCASHSNMGGTITIS